MSIKIIARNISISLAEAYCTWGVQSVEDANVAKEQRIQPSGVTAIEAENAVPEYLTLLKVRKGWQFQAVSKFSQLMSAPAWSRRG